MRPQVLRRSEDTIGEVAALLTAAMEAALRAGEERIGRTARDMTVYQPPTVRRRLFERELRWVGIIDPVPAGAGRFNPKPGEWEVLQTWLRRIADAYGVGCDTFLRKGLGRIGPAARDLETITKAQLAMLAAGTGISIEQLRGMNTAAMMGRLTAMIASWMLTEEG